LFVDVHRRDAGAMLVNAWFRQLFAPRGNRSRWLHKPGHDRCDVAIEMAGT
jgi:hypothetical protein